VARTVRDSKLDTRTARIKLEARREPYWRTLSEGLAIGYRRGAKGGTWIARHYAPEQGRRYKAIGTADDVADADGLHILSFMQAQEAARSWFADLSRMDRGGADASSYKVSDAVADYIADYRRRGGKTADRLGYLFNAHVLPSLGDILVMKLTRLRIETWRDKLADSQPRLRTKKGAEQKHREVKGDPDALRRRRSSANKALAMLKAALNFAYHRQRTPDRTAWEPIKPFRGADAPRIRFLMDEEVKRLVNTCAPDIRAIVTAGLLTGARYGELAAMRARNFILSAKAVHIPQSKSGKARHIALTDEGVEFFKQATAGLGGDAIVLTCP
jgi:hypothetical protein